MLAKVIFDTLSDYYKVIKHKKESTTKSFISKLRNKISLSTLSINIQ